MVRYNLLLLSSLSLCLLSSAASAGELTFWRFDSNQNRLIFTTNEAVQPKAQLISNPTRLVIDLPGTTLGRATANQTVKGSSIDSVRVGQFNQETTRVVIQLARGYTLNPQQVEFRGTSPTQWLVNLPKPEPVKLPLPNNIPPPNQPGVDLERSAAPRANTESSSSKNVSPYLQVTKNGLFVRIGAKEADRINVSRSSDRRQIDVYLEGISFPPNLAGTSLPVDSYGVNEIAFSQTSTSPPVARLSMNVTEDSPDWQASLSRLGGVVLLPQGGVRAASVANSSSRNERRQNNRRSSEVTIKSIELKNDNSELLIRAQGTVKPTSRWNAEAGVYEIRIPNAKLDKKLRGPNLDANSSISKLRIREQAPQSVLITVEPAIGVQIGQLNRRGSELLALGLRKLQPVSPSSTAIAVPPPETKAPPSFIINNPRHRTQARDTTPRPTSSRDVPKEQIVVVVDAGHGGKDPGAIGIGGLQEKNIILPISQEVSKLLEKQGIKVIMTRSSDYFVSLNGRTQMANRAGADLFVSIHANSIGLSRPDVNGLETYYYDSGRGLASTIHSNILRRVNIRDRGVRRARFYVLRNSDMPAVLVEVGFLTGREDAANLSNSNYRSQMAEAIAAGVLEYIKKNRL